MKPKQVTVATKLNLQHTAVAEFRQVLWQLIGGHIQMEIVHRDEVDRLIEAVKELYYEPGRNPYNNRKLDEVATIQVGEATFTGPFWWSTPGLGKIQPEASGVAMIGWKHKTVWMNPKLKDQDSNND